MTNTSDAFICEVDGNAQPGFLDEPALDLVERYRMLRRWPNVFTFWLLPPARNAVDVLVNVGKAVLPEFFLSLSSREIVFHDPLISIERDELTRLLVEVHMSDKIINARVDLGLGILVGVTPPVLVQIDPIVMIQRVVELGENDLLFSHSQWRQDQQQQEVHHQAKHRVGPNGVVGGGWWIVGGYSTFDLANQHPQPFAPNPQS